VNITPCPDEKGATLCLTITLTFLVDFYTFAPMKTGMNTPESYVIYLLNHLMTS